MLISLNEIKKLVPISLDDESLLKLIGSRLVEIESVEDLSKKYKKIYVVKVLKTEPIEGTHLSLCKIDAGAKLNKEVDSEHENYIQVVCGAPNVREGMVAAWIAPGAVVPSTFSTPDPFEISARPLRGFMSFGMLAGADELSLGDDHSGIVELDPALKPGDLFADTYGLNDKVLEVENKSLTHRPDCFGLIGFAREVAGILGQTFSEPDFYRLPAETSAPRKSAAASTSEKSPVAEEPNLPAETKVSNGSASISVASPDICPRYTYAVFDVKNSRLSRPPFLTENDIFLYKSGMRPISPLVDLTNILMLKTGQPLHAFDYDKFLAAGSDNGNDKRNNKNAPRIGVRLARENEKLLLLDDREISLTKDDIVITSGDTPVALAGAMGGKSTEIDDTTKTVLLESATFSLYNLRKTQMAHGLFSEAITRFTKGQSAFQSPLVLAEALRLLDVEPRFSGDSALNLPEKTAISVSPETVNAILGSSYSSDLMQKTLENVGFSVIKTTMEAEEILEVTAPFWRTDIKIKEDVAEEIGRLLGFDNLPLSFPTRPFIAPSVDPLLKLKSNIRLSLSGRLGAHEILSYSFVSDSLLRKANLDPEDSYKIVNSISPDLERFRPSLLPSLLEKLRLNLKAGYKNPVLYELNQTARKHFEMTDENVPDMKTMLAIVLPADFYTIKTLFLELAHDLKKLYPFDFSLRPFTSSYAFEPKRSLAIFLNVGGTDIPLGALGELKSSVKNNFKLSGNLSALEILLDPCILAQNTQKPDNAPISKNPGTTTENSRSIKLSKYPSTSRDLTLRLPEATPFATVESALEKTLKQLEAEDNLHSTIEPLSIYHRKLSPTKNLSFRFTFSNPEKTFTSSEISVIMEKIINSLSALGVEVV